MPLMTCKINGRSGWKWGQGGKCYTGPRAKKKAILQGVAAGGGKLRHDAVKPENPFVTYLKALGLTLPKIRSRLRRRGPVRPTPRTVERQYEIKLKRLVAEWRTLYLQTVDPHLEGLAQEAYALKPPQSVGVKTDAWPEKLDLIAKDYERQIAATLAPVESVALATGYDVSDLNLKQWKQTVSRVVGINIYASEPWLTDQVSSFSKQNVQLITKLAEETRADIERIIEDGFQRGRRIENIRKDILSNSQLTPGRFRKTRTRATLIARDQTNKLNGQLSQLRQNEINVDRYIWHTVADERVRTSHRVMNGLLCRWDNATVYSQDGGKTWVLRSGIGGTETHPGQDIQCRCFPEADFSSVLGDPAPITKPPAKKKKKKKAAPPPAAPPPAAPPPGEKKEKKKKKSKKLVLPDTDNTLVDLPDTPVGKRAYINATRKNDFETLAIVDRKTNKVTWAKRGEKHSVSFAPDDLKAMEQQTVIHNHPSSRSFSEADFEVALRGRVGTMEVYSREYTYKLKSINKSGEWTFKDQLIYQRINGEVRKDLTLQVAAEDITVAHANAIHHHEINKRFAKETGLFKYERIKVK